MKFPRYLMIAAAAIGSMAVMSSPAKATTATVMEFSGSVSHGTSFNTGATVTFNGSGPCAEANSTPAGGGRVCGFGATGSGKGTCAAWSATVTGSLNPVIPVAGPSPRYTNMKLKLTADTHVLTISGTADSSSGTKQVSGKATIDSWDGGCFSTGGNNLTVVGSLTISG